MRLRTSGDRHEIRQQYLPLLWSKLVKILETGGKESVPEVIALMDSYFLTKDDWDAILELGVGPMDMERVKVESQTKATFTRSFVTCLFHCCIPNAYIDLATTLRTIRCRS